MNFYLIEERDDPGHLLQWLEGELKDIQENGGYAIIIGHIPPVECLHQFGARYHALLDRYQNIIRFSSFAHDHTEDFLVTRAMGSEQAIGFNFVAGSATTMLEVYGINPGFTLVDFDEEYMVPVNIHVYYMDMVESNKHPD